MNISSFTIIDTSVHYTSHRKQFNCKDATELVLWKLKLVCILFFNFIIIRDHIIICILYFCNIISLGYFVHKCAAFITYCMTSFV